MIMTTKNERADKTAHEDLLSQIKALEDRLEQFEANTNDDIDRLFDRVNTIDECLKKLIENEEPIITKDIIKKALYESGITDNPEGE